MYTIEFPGVLKHLEKEKKEKKKKKGREYVVNNVHSDFQWIIHKKFVIERQF